MLSVDWKTDCGPCIKKRMREKLKMCYRWGHLSAQTSHIYEGYWSIVFSVFFIFYFWFAFDKDHGLPTSFYWKLLSLLHKGLQIPSVVLSPNHTTPAVKLHVTGPAGKHRVIPGSCFQGCDTSPQTRITKLPPGGRDNTEERAWWDCKVMSLLIKRIFKTGCSLSHTHISMCRHTPTHTQKHSPYGLQMQHRWPVNSSSPLPVKQLIGDCWTRWGAWIKLSSSMCRWIKHTCTLEAGVVSNLVHGSPVKEGIEQHQ